MTIARWGMGYCGDTGGALAIAGNTGAYVNTTNK